eukprot:CAMPEP_0206458986 /NCGR_PEP_ID=MMETSP0324_2-20121206/23907_1 /ASSEMBLY_ACC=CAM_ASM_000836 /TAXON_ID=2866 /ORGANISM="Crypthecodinium cohnii, Strain Seligo" /LENGTH=171 /DNA_ID=CAMNT_0053930451 /DNA_START=59 /DNA_END=571 /DNA_ORIENTATION=-
MSGRLPLKSRPILEAVVNTLAARRAAAAATAVTSRRGVGQGCLPLGRASPSVASSTSNASATVKKEIADLPGVGLPIWHLARSLQSRGHFLNVGVPVTGLISEHGVCATPAWLDDELKEVSRTMPLIAGGHGGQHGGNGGVPASALLCSRSEEAVRDLAFGSGMALPMDYW